MGHRANYVIRREGVNELFYSHWGALTIAEDVFWGPEKVEAFIRANKLDDEGNWLDSVWAEGGIALNFDEKRLSYYYFEWPDSEDVRAVYEELLADRWRGWRVERAAEWGDLAESVGVDRAAVTAERTPPTTIAVSDLGGNLKEGLCRGLLSVRAESGWQDYAVDYIMAGLLLNGPQLLLEVQQIAPIDAIRAAFANRNSEDTRATPGDWLSDLAAIDSTRREIRLVVPYCEDDQIDFVRAAWPGWDIVIAKGGPEEHFAFTGRPCPEDFVPSPKEPEPPAPQRSRAECERIIWEQLGGADQRKDDTQAFFLRTIEKLSADDGGPVTVAPGSLDRVPSVRVRVWTKISMFLRRIRSGAF